MRISEEGNYIKIVHEEGQFNGATASDFAKDVYMVAEGNIVTINSPRLGNLSYTVAQVTDGAGAAMTIGEIQTFATTKTGNFSRAVGSTVASGVYDYNDLATASVPIAIAPVDGLVTLTNDGLGSFTDLANALPSAPNVYDTITNAFDFSNLEIGDSVDIRLDMTVTTTLPNTEISASFVIGDGEIGSYSLPFTTDVNYKNTGSYNIMSLNSFYIGNAFVKDNPHRIKVSVENASTVIVNGWYCRVIKKSI